MHGVQQGAGFQTHRLQAHRHIKGRRSGPFEDALLHPPPAGLLIAQRHRLDAAKEPGQRGVLDEVFELGACSMLTVTSLPVLAEFSKQEGSKKLCVKFTPCAVAISCTPRWAMVLAALASSAVPAYIMLHAEHVLL